MKNCRITLLLLFLITPFLSIAQEELAKYLGSHKEWNVAYVKDLRVDSTLITNAILIQAYSDEEWAVLLDTLGVNGEGLRMGGNSENVLFWFADTASCEQGIIRNELRVSYMGFGRTADRTIAIYFPHTTVDLSRIFALYLTKSQHELRLFSQKCCIQHVSVRKQMISNSILQTQ